MNQIWKVDQLRFLVGEVAGGSNAVETLTLASRIGWAPLTVSGTNLIWSDEPLEPLYSTGMLLTKLGP